MKQIAVQPYYKIEREITGREQKYLTDEREMVLYEDRLVTHRREFPLCDIFDMSYRRLGAGEGLFYLHTSKGVFSYTIRQDPARFIRAFKERGPKRSHAGAYRY
ncbi:hypothetical protein [Paenibacillus wulumuqiensis]|uniref:hypothetical protein n=1 Tax=Paenibacillus wulumuqiensis TaxID=1567107 RepID=UPI0006195B0C|nr:hypothetical protein [Paenibacillus wulumuqiensis]